MNKSLHFSLLIIAVFITTSACYSQIDFQFSHLTDDVESDRTNYFFDLKDIDNDGDLDIVSATFFGETIVWFENIDGLGGFGEAIVVDDIDVGSYSIEGVDLDGDNDIDILAALHGKGSFENAIVWYENLNGEGEFSPRKILFENSKGFRKVVARDIDNDGDLDIIFILDNAQAACYILLNEDGLYTLNQLSDSEEDLWDFIFEDVDDDGIKDIITIGFKHISIIKNKGNGEFEPEKRIYDVDYGASIKAYDLDNDDDLDLVATLFYDSIIILNNLGDMNFELGDIFFPGPGNNSDVYGINANNDPFIDLCVGTSSGFYLIENSGDITDISKENTFYSSKEFSPYRIIVSDINIDSKEDIIGCSIGKNDLGIYTNLSMLTSSVKQNEKDWELKVIADQLHLNPLLNIDRVSIYNSSGQLVYSSDSKEYIDILPLINGIYFYQLIGDDSIYSGQFLIVK